MTENKKASALDWANFFAKYLVIGISAIWTLNVGTEYIDKQTKELQLRNFKLSKKSNPVAYAKFSKYNNSNSPMKHAERLCTVTGAYQVKNAGELPIIIENIKFSVYELPIIIADHLENRDSYSISVNKMVEKLEPKHQETHKVSTRISTEGEAEWAFGFIIRRAEYKNYVVMATAEGGLAGLNGSVDENNRFNLNELTSYTKSGPICGIYPAIKKEA